MARPLRVEYPGAFYHVINRGNAGEKIFRSIQDREKFLEYLEASSERFSIRIYTYCLMTNHYHLLMETPQANLSQAIKWINVSYAVYFNCKRNRVGHLFQGRYKAILVDADAYLKHLSRYIHLNPLRAKVVERLDAHPWSSYPAFIGKTKPPPWLETDWLLSLFGSRRKTAERNYQKFVEVQNWDSIEDPAKKNMTGGFLLGSSEFVNWVKKTFINKVRGRKEIPQIGELQLFPSIDTIVDDICAEFGCKKIDVIHKGQKGNLPRDIAIYLSRKMSGETNVRLGNHFGQVSGAAITMRYRYIAEQLKKNRELKGRVNKVQKKIANI